MESREEKIKKFLSDKKKLKALVNDETFIDKVSGGCATPEAYQEELKKLGLEINSEEAEQIQNTVNKIFETPTEKLDDDFLENVSGGGTAGKIAAGVGIGVASLALADCLAVAGCAIAGEIYRSKAIRAAKDDNENAAWRYVEKALRCEKIIGYLAVVPAICDHIENG